MTLKMTSAQVVETSVIVNSNSSFQNYTNPDDHTQQTTDTPGFKPFTVILLRLHKTSTIFKGQLLEEIFKCSFSLDRAV